MSSMAGAQELDYAAEGEKLLALVGLQGAGAPERYAPANPIWKHPETGALLYVGNAGIASDARALAQLGIARVVYCQEADGKCHFEKDPSFVYLKFPIGLWRRERALAGAPSDAAVLAYFAPLFGFVSEQLGAGRAVLIHCLAGAHRAGTAGVASLMHLCDLDARTAVRIAQTARPAINPIGSFPELLGLLDRARANAKADAAGGGGPSAR